MQLPLDHNFPEPIVNALKPWMGALELLPIRQIDDRLTGLDDRPLLIALLLDLPSAVKAVEAGASGVFWMRPRAPQPQDPRDLFDEAATRRHEDPAALYASVEVSDAELREPVLAASR